MADGLRSRVGVDGESASRELRELMLRLYPGNVFQDGELAAQLAEEWMRYTAQNEPRAASDMSLTNCLSLISVWGPEAACESITWAIAKG